MADGIPIDLPSGEKYEGPTFQDVRLVSGKNFEIPGKTQFKQEKFHSPEYWWAARATMAEMPRTPTGHLTRFAVKWRYALRGPQSHSFACKATGHLTGFAVRWRYALRGIEELRLRAKPRAV
jgi:hypothetical protein